MADPGDRTAPPCGPPGETPPPEATKTPESDAQELIRLRAEFIASQHPRNAPPSGTILPPAAAPANPRLDGMRQMLTIMLDERQESATAHTMSLLARHERDLAYQARATELVETQRVRAVSIGTSPCRTANVAKQLDMLETLLMDQMVVSEMFNRAIQPATPSLSSPPVPGSPVPLAPPKLWIDSDDGVCCKKHHDKTIQNIQARIQELLIIWASPTWSVSHQTMAMDATFDERQSGINEAVRTAISVEEKKQKEEDKKRKARNDRNYGGWGQARASASASAEPQGGGWGNVTQAEQTPEHRYDGNLEDRRRSAQRTGKGKGGKGKGKGKPVFPHGPAPTSYGQMNVYDASAERGPLGPNDRANCRETGHWKDQ